MIYKLDNRDKEILKTISNNARLSYNQIAKITHISKDSVRKRILKLEREGVIHSYFLLLNYSKLGICKFNIYCKLKTTKYLSSNQIKPLLKNPNISGLTWLMGEFDFELQILAKNKSEMKKILQKTEFWKNIEKYKIVIADEPIIYSTSPVSSNTLPKPKNTNNELSDLDKKDIELMNLLSMNSREKIIELAEKLKLEEYEVRYKIRKMIKKEIIRGFYARTARSSLGKYRYLMLLKVKNNLGQKEEDLLKNIKNIYYLKKSHGLCNYLLRFYTNSNDELIETIKNIKDLLSKNLLETRTHTIIDIMKFNPSPRLLLEKQTIS